VIEKTFVHSGLTIFYESGFVAHMRTKFSPLLSCHSGL
jgi:hypothetical protein